MDRKLFEDIPPFEGGETDGIIYSVGCGLEDDFGGVATKGDSGMLIYKNATENQFRNFVNALSKAFPGVMPHLRKDRAGLGCEFDLEERTLYAYYIAHSGTVRIIDDRAGDGIDEFIADVSPAGESEPLLVQYGLYYDKMIPMVTSDCGMLYFIRLRDNRLVMLDGGEIEQCTVPAVEDVMKTMHRLTGSAPGEKITIAAWLCTHAHDDHMDLFTKIIHDYKDEIAVERVAFNFPAFTVIEHCECVQRLKSRIKQFCPDAKYLKVHTGQSFVLGGVKFEILLTHEDIIDMKLRRPYDGMNGTTTVYKATANGKSVIFLGDLQDEGADELAERYPEEELACSYLQAAHHCINSVDNAYKHIKTGKVLIPQSEDDCRTRNAHNFAHIIKYNEDSNCIFAGNGTDVFGFGESCEPVEHRDVVGCPYDGSEY